MPSELISTATRISRDEHEALTFRARQRKLSLSEYLRFLVQEHINGTSEATTALIVAQTEYLANLIRAGQKGTELTDKYLTDLKNHSVKIAPALTHHLLYLIRQQLESNSKAKNVLDPGDAL